MNREGQNRKAMVTGATGFIGRALIARLIAKGYDVWAAVRSPEKLRDMACEQLHTVRAELGEMRELAKRTEERGFDVFFHLAWEGTFGESFRDYRRQLENAAYAGDAVLAAVELKAERFVFTGTVVELEARHYILTDGGEPRMSCVYGVAKTAAEIVCRTLAFQNGLAYNGALLASAYGEGDTTRTIQNVFITTIQRGESPKLVNGENLYDWIYVDDVVSGLMAIAERGQANKTYYVGHRELQTFKSLVTRTRDTVAPEVKLVFGTLQDKTMIDYSLTDLDALWRDTGFECGADFTESIRRTASWLQKLRERERERERTKSKETKRSARPSACSVVFPRLLHISRDAGDGLRRAA